MDFVTLINNTQIQRRSKAPIAKHRMIDIHISMMDDSSITKIIVHPFINDENIAIIERTILRLLRIKTAQNEQPKLI